MYACLHLVIYAANQIIFMLFTTCHLFPDLNLQMIFWNFIMK